MVPRLENFTRKFNILLLLNHLHAVVLPTQDPLRHLLANDHPLRGDAPQTRQLVPALDIFQRLNDRKSIHGVLLNLSFLQFVDQACLFFLELAVVVSHPPNDVGLLIQRLDTFFTNNAVGVLFGIEEPACEVL